MSALPAALALALPPPLALGDSLPVLGDAPLGAALDPPEAGAGVPPPPPQAVTTRVSARVAARAAGRRAGIGPPPERQKGRAVTAVGRWQRAHDRPLPNGRTVTAAP
jgi:hypothetical protein